MILIQCYYAEHRCELYRVREDAAGVLVAVRCEWASGQRFRPAADREMERKLASYEVWPLATADLEKFSGLRMPAAEDWVRDHL